MVLVERARKEQASWRGDEGGRPWKFKMVHILYQDLVQEGQNILYQEGQNILYQEDQNKHLIPGGRNNQMSKFQMTSYTRGSKQSKFQMTNRCYITGSAVLYVKQA